VSPQIKAYNHDLYKDEIDLLHEKAFIALKEAVKEVIERHKKSGRPLPIWENGKVKYISAAQALKRK
jgi:hypothetical protein